MEYNYQSQLAVVAWLFDVVDDVSASDGASSSTNG